MAVKVLYGRRDFNPLSLYATYYMAYALILTININSPLQRFKTACMLTFYNQIWFSHIQNWEGSLMVANNSNDISCICANEAALDPVGT